jgi:SAM-dependent methyltransferase
LDLSALQIATEEVGCNLCGSHESRPIARGTDREYATSDNEFHIVECLKCGLRYLNPRPTVNELGRIYPPNYHAYNIRPKGQTEQTLPLVTRLRHKLYSRRFATPLRLLADRPKIDVLDVGCGDGWMLDLYKLADPTRIQTHGVDFNAEVCAVARANGHEVYCARFEDLAMSGRFDLVNISHVIEHVSDPTAVARKSFEVLKPGGLFVIETPNIDTVDCRMFLSGDWGAYHFPRHWNLFDPRTLRQLGENAGFRLAALTFHPAPVHWVWSLHNVSLRKSGWMARIGQRLFAPLDVFGGGSKAFLMLAAGTLADMIVYATTRRTSNMMAVFRKESP